MNYKELPPYERFMFLKGYTADEIYWSHRKFMIEEFLKKKTIEKQINDAVKKAIEDIFSSLTS